MAKAAPNQQSADVLINIEKAPQVPNYYTHAWVDQIEILCLTHFDRRLSKDELMDTWIQEGELNTTEATEEDAADLLKDGGQAEVNERQNDRVDEWYRILGYRVEAFGDNYPFSMSKDGDILVVKDNLTIEQKLYVFLLLCSSLPYVRQAGGLRQKLTGSFERLSVEVLKAYLPSTAQVHVFGTSQNSKFSGTLFEKIRTLAKELNEDTLCSASSFAATNNGDGGLDIVAWVPMEDSNSGMLVIFGQCGCTHEWTVKQHSSGFEAWRRRINFSTYPMNMVFIPHCYRDLYGKWLMSDSVNSILVDRERFIRLLSKNLQSFRNEDAYQLTEVALSQKRAA